MAVQFHGSQVLFPTKIREKTTQVREDVLQTLSQSFDFDDSKSIMESNAHQGKPEEVCEDKSTPTMLSSSLSLIPPSVEYVVRKEAKHKSNMASQRYGAAINNKTEKDQTTLQTDDAKDDFQPERSKIALQRYGVSKKSAPSPNENTSNEQINTNSQESSTSDVSLAKRTPFTQNKHTSDTATNNNHQQHTPQQTHQPLVNTTNNTSVNQSQDLPSKRHNNMVKKNAKTCDADVRFFNRRLNLCQRRAVLGILGGVARPAPYVVFGPPGTGKTVTVVEAVLQLCLRLPRARVLVAAPSNSAADLLALRLHTSGVLRPTDLVRLNAFSRDVNSIPEPILPVCRFAEDLEKVARHRVIVATCSMAGSLYTLGLSSGHVTHVIMDEAGQATEPEAAVALGLLSGTDGQLVLAGDPRQLGPIVMSPLAKLYGLELSFLERLMALPAYQRGPDGFDPRLVTMLVDNYRSHPAVLTLPSRLFYYGELVARGDRALTHQLAHAPFLPTAGHPVIFHGVRGTDMREGDSPSWFNPAETLQVVMYLQRALAQGVEPDHVGVITPYRKQVEKIRFMIDKLGLPEVKVGSVEEFQGQERAVVIMSTVRASERLVGVDARHSLGFLSSPKRFNVALTRAIALMVIIGSPHVLACDPHWRALLRHCRAAGALAGCDLPDLPDETEETELFAAPDTSFQEP